MTRTTPELDYPHQYTAAPRLPDRAGEPRGPLSSRRAWMLVVATAVLGSALLAGLGRTTLIKDYARQFPRYETQARTWIPAFYLETPSPVTVKGLAQKMLEELGDPAAYKGNQSALNTCNRFTD